MEKQKFNYKDSWFVFWICAIMCLITTVALVLITKHKLFPVNFYDSYYLQAQSWIERRLDLGKDYKHLELAIYNGKYYVSFPPFPSYLMLPFAALNFKNGEWLLAFISAMLGGGYAAAIMKHFKKSNIECIFWSLFVTIGSNWLFVAFTPWVWFIAQNLAFTLSVMSIYYALKGKAGLSLSFWACSVGCRPFQAIYGIVILYLLYSKFKEENLTIVDMIKEKWYCLIAPFLIALSYMILNYARFGNIVEFGHNYLPEFTRVTTGQFNASYLKSNLPKLIRWPITNNGGKLSWISMDGSCMFVASPIFISYIVYFIAALKNKENKNKTFIIFMFILLLVHLFVTALHKTMGGSHYGNRYTNDALPFVFLSLAYIVPSEKKYNLINIVPFVIGFTLNCIWSYLFFIK